ncbi:MAG: HAD-IIA family hydrolase [Spirochaetes bacterium]|jgi:NagD protein|nr:HAD-IIA family hydrolase [Spirochaetota bacterium]
MELAVISDMDGVIYRGGRLIEGASDFVSRMKERNIPFLFLTNNSEQTQLDLLRKLKNLGIEGLQENNFITSAMATATFLKTQKPNGTAYTIGGAALSNELYKAGFSLTETDPDYVVVGKTKGLNFDMLKRAINLINRGAKFIATNPDMVDPVENGLEPACGTIIAAIEAATGKQPYVVGKPNALMMMIAKQMLGVHSAQTVMVGDRMDTDIVSGLEAGMRTCLVLSGVSDMNTLSAFPYRPTYIHQNVGEIDFDLLLKETEAL